MASVRHRPEAAVGSEGSHLFGPVVGEHVARRSPQHEHGAAQRRGVLGQALEDVSPVGQVVGADLPGAPAPSEAVLPDPAPVRPLPEVAAQALGPDGLAPGQVDGDLLGRLLERGEGLVGTHEVDDALHALFFQAVTDVDEDDSGHQFRMSSGQGDGRDAAEGRAHDDRRSDAEVLVQGREGGCQGVAADVVDGVGVAVAGEVGRHQVVDAGEGGPELLVHVRRLSAAVQAQNVGCPHVAPLEVVDLASVDDREAAATARGDVVPGDGVVAQRLSSHERLPA